MSPNPLVRVNLSVGLITKSFCIWLENNGPTYISSHNNRLLNITRMIGDISIEPQTQVSSVDVDDIVFAESKDDNARHWTMIKRKDKDAVDVFMFGWAVTETLDLSRLRHLTELGLSAEPANAMKIKIVNPPGPIADKFLECEAALDTKVESYDETGWR